MKVWTRNSVYRVEERAPGSFRVEKIADRYPGGHPNIRTGDAFFCTGIEAKVGEDFVLLGVFGHAHADANHRCSGQMNERLRATAIEKIEP